MLTETPQITVSEKQGVDSLLKKFCALNKMKQSCLALLFNSAVPAKYLQLYLVSAA